MQDKNKPRGFRRFLRDNGYYLVVGICVFSVGVSGFSHCSAATPPRRMLR